MLTRESGYRRTMTACFLGYIVQATICTLAPLLYARFQTEYQIPLGRISLMITLTFAIQLLVDLLSSVITGRKIFSEFCSPRIAGKFFAGDFLHT